MRLLEKLVILHLLKQTKLLGFLTIKVVTLLKLVVSSNCMMALKQTSTSTSSCPLVCTSWSAKVTIVLVLLGMLTLKPMVQKIG